MSNYVPQPIETVTAGQYVWNAQFDRPAYIIDVTDQLDDGSVALEVSLGFDWWEVMSFDYGQTVEVYCEAVA